LALLERLEAKKAHRLARTKLLRYKPYAKQREFHDAGRVFRERLLMAGNQLGKTYSGAAELAYHLTGDYPADWNGRRFDRPVRAWAGSKTGEVTRDGVQRLLVGEPKDRAQWGTGLIPAATFTTDDTSSRQGVADALDSVTVQHKSGGRSTLGFKSYDQGREKWQGETLDIVWFDEEPPEDIYSEGLTRTNATGGMAFMTFTPLLGMSNVVRRFLSDKSPDRHVTTMTIDDAEHYSPEQRARIIASYPAHEREARTKGVPTLGSGRIFPVPEESIRCEPLAIPRHWPLIGGIDFGWDHPTAAAKLAWDRDADIVYVVAAYRVKEATPVIHAGALKSWGPTLPWAWPHDGLQHDKGSGLALAEQYRTQGLSMLPDRATFPDGSNGVEAGLMEMLDRMQTGRLKVFAHLSDWFDEFRLYHREDGKVVKEYDDLMSATRYALMMLRNAMPADRPTPRRSEHAGAGGWMG
jgi:phage terminase large subunit-like protein